MLRLAQMAVCTRFHLMETGLVLRIMDAGIVYLRNPGIRRSFCESHPGSFAVGTWRHFARCQYVCLAVLMRPRVFGLMKLRDRALPGIDISARTVRHRRTLHRGEYPCHPASR